MGALLFVWALDRGPGGEGEQLGGVVEPPRSLAQPAATTARRWRASSSNGSVSTLWRPVCVSATSGCRIVLMPWARARRHRSMSSANMWMPGSKGPSDRSVSVWAASAAAIAQPTVRGLSARCGSARGGRDRRDRAGRKAPSVPGSGWALRCTLPSWLSSRGACRPGACARRASSSGEPTMSGFSRTVTGCVTRSRARLLAAPKPGLSRRTMTSAPCSRASCAPPSSGPASTTTSCVGVRAWAAAARDARASGAARRRRRSRVTGAALSSAARRSALTSKCCLGAAARVRRARRGRPGPCGAPRPPPGRRRAGRGPASGTISRAPPAAGATTGRPAASASTSTIP